MTEAQIIDWLKILVPLVSAVVTAIWGIRKWQREQNQKHDDERARVSALYVNPFLLACEELQSRLYNILSYDGLQPLNARYPDGSYAEEILYLIAQYFGWQQCMFRYGPYAQDSRVLKLTEAIARDFATDTIEIGPLCFFRPEQRSLGRLAVERASGQFGTEFETVSLAEYVQKLEEYKYSEKLSVRQSLEVLREAKDISDIPHSVCERMRRIQNTLVELLEYIESKERLTLFQSARYKKRQLSTLPEISKSQETEAAPPHNKRVEQNAR